MRETELPVDGIECANHSGVHAEANCSVCGKPVCADCSVQLNRGNVCEDPGHRTVLEEWAIVLRSNSEFEADMIVRNLECQGLKTKTFSSRAFKEKIGEDAHEFVQVFVHQGESQRAQDVLSTLGLLNCERETQGTSEGGSTFV